LYRVDKLVGVVLHLSKETSPAHKLGARTKIDQSQPIIVKYPLYQYFLSLKQGWLYQINTRGRYECSLAKASTRYYERNVVMKTHCPITRGLLAFLHPLQEDVKKGMLKHELAKVNRGQKLHAPRQRGDRTTSLTLRLWAHCDMIRNSIWFGASAAIYVRTVKA
jgi:hypothetical protein